MTDPVDKLTGIIIERDKEIQRLNKQLDVLCGWVAEKDKEIALLEKTVSAREGSAIALATASRTEIERLRRENNSLRGQPND